MNLVITCNQCVLIQQVATQTTFRKCDSQKNTSEGLVSLTAPISHQVIYLGIIIMNDSLWVREI